ncbi:nucleoside-diphosphate sugar epimerase/dehydratase [Aliivibrio sifiae]|uniref:Nucleoside-diphosphate sugar epimerase n=1 Tax=Aliivibrio sifiae TaxID=566293 RepID=A0A2S7X5R8_9GAMM|nr:nucleoside-diphosphate sugar epimerase/dehydratase [Aliivibrio sifiae]PQJ85379.1 nucleoside-diphosphate sugar epimerase [Aliivibrio sifiae]GLR76444.1 nucleoside-diphosphate sugar epimerase [Aliivibrio sifiae]
MQFLQPIWGMPRPLKRTVSVVVDVFFIVIAFWAAFATRLDNITDDLFFNIDYWQLLAFLVPCTLLVFTKSGLYRAILRYLSLHAVLSITISAVISSAFIVFFSYFNYLFMPRSIPVLYATYLVVLCGGSRLLVRLLLSDILGKQKKKVLIYGAGSAGLQLANMLRQGKEYHPVAFIDDDRKKHKTTIQGITIFRPKYLDYLIKKHSVSTVLLAIPSVKQSQKKQIIESLALRHIEVLTIPNLDDLVNGKLSIGQLKEVSIDDLLGRDPVAPRPMLMEANIKDKVVMVTGAGGSIGSELCRQIILHNPKILVLFELSEFGLYQIERELSQLAITEGLSVQIIPLLGSVQRLNRLTTTMSSFQVQTVYHAAAYKHVPLVEYNVVEGIRNNIFGTNYTARAAIEAKVESFVLISTDKAVRPTNVMGTTKRMAELGLQALAEQENKKENGTRFCMVRFGNVLGSSGSVIPLFKKQIAKGGPVTLTHPDITRYFMTIPEAAQLVIQAGAMGKGGDVFVLDMGESVKIADLARNLIHLSDLDVKDDNNPDGDIEILCTGLRPGEKLYEELLIGEDVGNTEHERIMTAREDFLPLNEYNDLLDKLDLACYELDHETIRQLLIDAPTGFAPVDGIGDLVWKAQEQDTFQRD